MVNDAEMRDISKTAREVWGIDAQMSKLIEESKELAKALVKYKECGAVAISHVIEEMVDVSILLIQMQYYLGTLEGGMDLYEKWFKAKVARLENILERERKNYEEIVSHMDANPK